MKISIKTALEHGIKVRPTRKDKDGEYEKLKKFTLGDTEYVETLDKSIEE